MPGLSHAYFVTSTRVGEYILGWLQGEFPGGQLWTAPYHGLLVEYADLDEARKLDFYLIVSSYLTKLSAAACVCMVKSYSYAK